MVVVPYFKYFEEVSERLRQAGVKLVVKTGTTMGVLVKRKEMKTGNGNSIV